MDFATEDNTVEESLPLTLQAIATGNRAVIEADQVTAIQQRRLGESKTTVRFEDMSHCDLVETDEGYEIRIKKTVGNALTIGPLEEEEATRAHALIMKLWKPE